MVDFYTCCTNGNRNKCVDPGAKINGQYYRDVMLTQHLLPTMSHIAGNMFIFQQDSAPAHRARETIELLFRDTPDFIGPEMWPPNSPDLNPVDYSFWSVMEQAEQRVYQERIQSTGTSAASANRLERTRAADH